MLESVIDKFEVPILLVEAVTTFSSIIVGSSLPDLEPLMRINSIPIFYFCHDLFFREGNVDPIFKFLGIYATITGINTR